MTTHATLDAGLIDRLDTLIQGIHAATGKEENWDSIVGDVGRLLGGTLAVIERHHFASGRGAWLYQAPKDERLAADYLAKHSLRNPWFISSAEYTPARILTGEELVRREQLLKSDFYLQFLRPHDLLHRLCGVIVRSPDSVCHFTVYRGPEKAAFGPDHKRLLGRVLSHLSLALNNHWRLRQASGLNRIFWSLIDHFDSASMLADGAGEVIHRNDKTDQLMRRFKWSVDQRRAARCDQRHREPGAQGGAGRHRRRVGRGPV